MEIIEPSVCFLDDIDGHAIMRKLERYGRTCYKSEDKITDDSADQFVKMVIGRGHESVLEHISLTANFICDRGVTHELVRHRIGSYSQESTRFCNYVSAKFENQIRVIQPPGLNEKARDLWVIAATNAEYSYFALRNAGCQAQIARSVLPICLKTEIVTTFNLRQWRHFFKLRCSLAAHPQMRKLALAALNILYSELPVVFEDSVKLASNGCTESKN